MKEINATLLTALRTNNLFLAADLVSVALTNGTTLRWTTANQAITYGGQAYTVAGPVVTRPSVRQSNQFEVGQMDLTILLGTTPATLTGDLFDTRTLAHAATDGAFDAARVTVSRLWASGGAWSSPIGTPLVRFAGTVAGVDLKPGQELRLTVKSDLEKLEQEVPQAIYSPLCTYQLYDAGCGVARASFTSTGAALASSTATQVNWAGSLAAHRYGWIEFTSGVLTGVRRSISGATAGNHLDLATPLPSAPATGDAFKVLRGCNKLPPSDSRNTCQAVFSNGNRHRGFPTMPTEDSSK